MIVKLTKKWRKFLPNSKSYYATYGYIILSCYHYSDSFGKNQWSGIAPINNMSKLVGPIRKSVEAAQQDAQRLAVELLRDIRDGTKALMDYYEMGEDD